MNRRLPPLNALRAFEAAARHLSFTKSAQELNVTPAAISHQIKTLEEFLGVQLFRRTHRAVLLTDAGQRCLPVVRESFDNLAEIADLARAQDQSGILQVSAGPAFAVKWLVPRLKDFAEAHPNIDVRVAASLALADFRTDQVDVAIRFGFGKYPGLRVDKLFDEVLVPMCSPRLRDGDPPLLTPDDLRHHTLLHDDSTRFDPAAPNWARWLRAADVSGIDSERGPRFDHADHALQAAIDGLGVVLSGPGLASGDLAAGRLVMPFALQLPWLAFYVVAPEATADKPKIVAFREWLLAEAAEMARLSAKAAALSKN